jgi:hypothetical protein
MDLQQWIDSKFLEISKKLPSLVNTFPEGFECGYQTGYKACLLELDRLLEDNNDE